VNGLATSPQLVFSRSPLARAQGEHLDWANERQFRALDWSIRRDCRMGADQQTTNLIINLDHDEWILEDESKTLVEVGARECLPSLIRVSVP
jgi:hypothetical protein